MKPGKQGRMASQGRLDFGPTGDGYETPPLTLMDLPAEDEGKHSAVTKDALEKNARLLESVLEDFGVRGEIIKIRPGPVVTRYELEPAPGTKTSRVVGLADDIAPLLERDFGTCRRGTGLQRHRRRATQPQARSGVPARTAWPRKSTSVVGAKLPMALGKDIGGNPSIVDLARMPHLLGGRHHRLRQVGGHQCHDPLASLPPWAGGLQADHDRPQDVGAVGL